MSDESPLKFGGGTAEIPSRPPDCLRCKYFDLTWEPAFPRCCKIFGIKCRNMPSAEVFLSTGNHCFAFEPRKNPSRPPDPEEGIWA